MSDLRKTKIICTLGPAVESEDLLRALVLGGMNAARFNFSHSTHEEHLARLTRLRAICSQLDRPVAAILDTRGPEIRIRSFSTPRVHLESGASFTLLCRDAVGDSHQVSVSYPNLHREVAAGQEILLDDGLIALQVDHIEAESIHCTVKNGGTLSANKSVNIPGVSIELPALTDADRADIRFGAQHGFDYVAASFVRRASDVEQLRAFLRSCGGEGIKIIAKIENQEGVDHLEEILAVSDAIMVARGDLGVEIPAARVPVLQKQIIQACRRVGKPVITATQMLDSMMRNPRPTRAEVSDVANAVFDGTSCVMLSGETAGGAYPLEALAVMARVVEETERSIHYWKRFQKLAPLPAADLNDAITHASCLTAMTLNASAILTPTNTGHTARMVARFRPQCPIAALTPHEAIRRQLALCWGVIPLSVGSPASTDLLFSCSAQLARQTGLAFPGDTVVITAGIPLGRTGATNVIKAHLIDPDSQ